VNGVPQYNLLFIPRRLDMSRKSHENITQRHCFAAAAAGVYKSTQRQASIAAIKR
jgi:hypothetical protein